MITGIHGLPFDQQNDDRYWQTKQILPNILRPLGTGIKNAAIINEGVYNINPIAGTNNFGGRSISLASGLNPTNYSLVNSSDIEDRLRANAVPENDPLSAQYAVKLAPDAQMNPNSVEGDAMLNTFRSEESIQRNAQSQVYDENLTTTESPDEPGSFYKGESSIYGKLRANLNYASRVVRGIDTSDVMRNFLTRNAKEAVRRGAAQESGQVYDASNRKEDLAAQMGLPSKVLDIGSIKTPFESATSFNQPVLIAGDDKILTNSNSPNASDVIEQQSHLNNQNAATRGDELRDNYLTDDDVMENSLAYGMIQSFSSPGRSSMIMNENKSPTRANQAFENMFNSNNTVMRQLAIQYRGANSTQLNDILVQYSSLSNEDIYDNASVVMERYDLISTNINLVGNAIENMSSRITQVEGDEGNIKSIEQLDEEHRKGIDTLYGTMRAANRQSINVIDSTINRMFQDYYRKIDKSLLDKNNEYPPDSLMDVMQNKEYHANNISYNRKFDPLLLTYGETHTPKEGGGGQAPYEEEVKSNKNSLSSNKMLAGTISPEQLTNAFTPQGPTNNLSKSNNKPEKEIKLEKMIDEMKQARDYANITKTGGLAKIPAIVPLKFETRELQKVEKNKELKQLMARTAVFVEQPREPNSEGMVKSYIDDIYDSVVSCTMVGCTSSEIENAVKSALKQSLIEIHAVQITKQSGLLMVQAKVGNDFRMFNKRKGGEVFEMITTPKRNSSTVYGKESLGS